MFWYIGTLYCSHQPGEPKAFIELFTYIRIQFINIFAQIAVVQRNTLVQQNDQNHWKNLEIMEIYVRKYKVYM